MSEPDVGPHSPQQHLDGAGEMAPGRLKVGIAGLGNIGRDVARWLAGPAAAGLELVAVGGRHPERLTAALRELGHPLTRAVALADLPQSCDVLVDCLDPEGSLGMLDACVDLGRTVIPVSVSVLLEHPALIERAQRAGTRLRVPSGAVGGLDILKAAAFGTIHAVRVCTRKPPAGLAAEAQSGPVQVFSGSAREACRAFPRNVNIAATLALAGIGPDLTRVDIWSDPQLTRNVHEIEIDSDSTRIRLTLENLPSATNPRSSAVTAHSVCAVLADLVQPVRIGT
jgi:aspartate dehydrogenase